MRSLATRLSLGLILSLSLLVGLLAAVGGYSLRQLAEEFVAARLVHDLDALLVALEFDGRYPRLDRERVNPVFRQPYSGHYYKLVSGRAVLRSRSLWDGDLTIPAHTGSATFTRYYATGPDGHRLLGLARSFTVQGRRVTLAVTEDFTPLETGLWHLSLGLGLLALALLLVLLAAQRLIVRAGLRPLERTRQDILRLARGEIPRLPGQVPVEVRPLVEEINRLVDLTAQRLTRSRKALGNLAHALKTPLTVLSQLAGQPELQDRPQLRDELETQTRAMRRLMDRELKRARIAGGATPGQRVVLERELRDLLDTLGRIYRHRPVRVEAHIPPDSLFPGDRDDLLELLGNLLDNAFRFAAGRVRLAVERGGERLQIRVEDDGPGCADGELEQLIRRGVRADEAGAGAGLGLAIAADIVAQYDGRLELGRSADLGGFLARVELPAAGLC